VSKAKAPGVVTGRYGTLGEVFYVEEDYWPLNTALYVTDFKGNHPRFVAYFLENVLRNFQSDKAAVPGVNRNVLHELKVRSTDTKSQEKVADILSAYDDLLENNRRRMSLLEEAARQLYREWFVRLCFPGHEHTTNTNGVPEGWERVPAPDAVNINPSTKLSDEAEHWSVEMADLPCNSTVIQQAIRREGRSGSKFKNGDTLFARITPCLENGKTAFVDFLEEGEVARGSTEFIVLRSGRLTPESVYCLARTYDFRENAIKSMVGSSGRQRVQESCLEKFLVLVPSGTLLDVFTETVRPMFRQVKTLHSQNHKLRAARDLLVPRLMSGEIAV
jgi:type I restriction enzyme S subunit